MAADDEVAELYALAPEEFIGARDELARELRRSGQADEAAAVATLRKPTLAAWALNQVARDYPDDVSKLLLAGARLRRAQKQALGGTGGEVLRAATLERRGLAARVTAMAEEVLAEAGRDESAHLPAITATLDAALQDEGVAEQLRAGRLAESQEVIGFGFGAPDDDDDEAFPPPQAVEPKKAAKAAKAEPRPAKTAAAEKAAHRADELTAQAVAVRREFDQLSEAAEEAEEAADAAEEAARAARKTAADLRKKAGELRRAADRAEVKAATLEQQAWEAVDRARKA